MGYFVAIRFVFVGYILLAKQLCSNISVTPFLFIYFRVPACLPGQVATVEVAMDEQPFIMDIKLDGERLAIHIDNTLVSTNNTNSNTNNTTSSINNNGSSSNVSSNSGSNGDSKYVSPVLMYTRRRNDYSEHYAPLGEIVRESVAVMTGTVLFCLLLAYCHWIKHGSSQCLKNYFVCILFVFFSPYAYEHYISFVLHRSQYEGDIGRRSVCLG